MAIITIIGAGVMGSALSFPARENGNEVRIVGTPLDRNIIETAKKTNRHPGFKIDFPKGIDFFQIEDVEKAIKDADLICCGVSSFGVEWWAQEILPLLKEGTSLLSVTKGLIDTQDGKLLTFPEYWQSKTDKKLDFNAIGGPCIARELIDHDDTIVAFCGHNMDNLKKIKSYFATDYYHIALTLDIVGIETAVALKNGLACGVAIPIGSDMLKYNNEKIGYFNSQAAVFSQALIEMQRILTFQGSPDVTNLAIGVGDLYVTIMGGRSRKMGILLGKGLSVEDAKRELAGETLESIVIAQRCARAIKINIDKGILKKEDFPLLLHEYEVIKNDAKAKIDFEKMLYEKN